jgi:hypothetical protein
VFRGGLLGVVGLFVGLLFGGRIVRLWGFCGGLQGFVGVIHNKTLFQFWVVGSFRGA